MKNMNVSILRRLTVAAALAVVVVLLLLRRGDNASPQSGPSAAGRREPGLRSVSADPESRMTEVQRPESLRPKEDVTSVRIESLTNDEGVPGLAFELPLSTPIHEVSDPSGFLRVPTKWIVSGGVPRPSSAWWKVIDSSELRGAPPRLTLVRLLRLHGKVYQEGHREEGIDFRTAEVWVSALGPEGITLNDPRRAPGSTGWILEGIHATRAQFELASREYSLVVPRTDGLRIAARARGWNTQVSISPPSDMEVHEVEVNLWLHPVSTLRFRVAAGGAAVHGATVRVQVLDRIPFDTAYPSRLHPPFPDWAHSLAGPIDGRLLVKYARNAKESKIGIYELDLPFSGEGRLIVTLPGYIPYISTLSLDENVQEIDLGAAQDGARRVRLMQRGHPVNQEEVHIADVTEREFQYPVCSVRTERDGSIPASWLQPGREYWISFGDGSAFLRFADQRELELSDFPKSISGLDR